MRLNTVSLLILIAVSSLTNGCSSIPGIITAASKDPACVHIHVSSLYGSVDYSRTMPTNTFIIQ